MSTTMCKPPDLNSIKASLASSNFKAFQSVSSSHISVAAFSIPLAFSTPICSAPSPFSYPTNFLCIWSLAVGKDEDGVRSKEGSARVSLRIIQPEGEVWEAPPHLGGPQQQVARSRLVERRWFTLRAWREICCWRNRKAIHLGQGDKVALARVVQGLTSWGCFRRALCSQPMAPGLVEWKNGFGTRLWSPALIYFTLQIFFFVFPLELCLAHSSIAWHDRDMPNGTPS